MSDLPGDMNWVFDPLPNYTMGSLPDGSTQAYEKKIMDMTKELDVFHYENDDLRSKYINACSSYHQVSRELEMLKQREAKTGETLNTLHQEKETLVHKLTWVMRGGHPSTPYQRRRKSGDLSLSMASGENRMELEPAKQLWIKPKIYKSLLCPWFGFIMFTIPAKPMDQTNKSKLAYTPALKSPLKRNNGKNVSTFGNSPQAPKMKKRIITPIKDTYLDLLSWEIKEDAFYVIGTVVSIGDIVPVNGYGCSKVRRTVVIEDTQSLRIECTFWDKWALMWNEYAEKLDEVGHLDFVLMLAKIKYWNNKPAIHNALFGTRIYVNKDITPLQSFRKSYEANTGYNASEFKIEIHNPDIHVITPAEFMQGCLRKMVGMIRNIEPENILFKIIVRIFDESGSAQVVLFDNNVYKMTKLSAWQIMEEQGMDANQYFPDDLNQIIGKQYLFKIKYSQFNHNNNSHVYRAEKDEEDDITSQQNEENEVAVEFVVETSLDCFCCFDLRLRSSLDDVDGLDGTERGYQRLCLGEMFCLFKQRDVSEKKGELGAKADKPMVSPVVDEIAEPIVELEEQVIAQ
ncbi:replication protein A 70 kDa DNA-binding subunit B [Tanacetum coccineum]